MAGPGRPSRASERAAASAARTTIGHSCASSRRARPPGVSGWVAAQDQTAHGTRPWPRLSEGRRPVLPLDGYRISTPGRRRAAAARNVQVMSTATRHTRPAACAFLCRPLLGDRRAQRALPGWPPDHRGTRGAHRPRPPGQHRRGPGRLFTDLPRRQALVTSAAASAPASPAWSWPARAGSAVRRPRRGGGARRLQRSPPHRVGTSSRPHRRQVPGRRPRPPLPPMT